MITVGTLHTVEAENQVRLCAQVTMKERTQEVWFSVEPEFAPYLTDDRADAFVIAFLPAAMRLGADICCEAPVTKRLYYQLTTYLIPALAANIEGFHPISIHAPLTEKVLPCENAVGTGWTGGVDSMYTLMTHLNAAQPHRRLTHLLVANVGTLESDRNTELLQYMAQKARDGIARDQNLAVVAVDSNIQLLLDENYLSVAVFRLPAAVLALQKLFGAFLHSGAYEFSRFSFVKENSAYYELLPLSCFETDCTVFYSTGSHVSRIQKLKELSGFSPAMQYLHPCIYAQQDNCGKCGKCVRTMGALYALGTLDRFEQVFDLTDFYKHKDGHLASILAKKREPALWRGAGCDEAAGDGITPGGAETGAHSARGDTSRTEKTERGMTLMSETLSVIIPAHQAEKYIAQAVASVRAQNWEGETEIIVIDDGSTDGTAAAAEALGVKVIRKAQGGAASARNEGLRAATGDLIALLDADDVLTDGALAAMYDALSGGADAVFAMAEDFVSPELTDAQKAELKVRPAAYGGVLPGCSLIRRQVFDAVGLFDDTMKSGETVAWQLKLRDAQIKTAQIPVVTLKRRLHLTNTGRLQQKQEMANYAALLRKRMKKA